MKILLLNENPVVSRLVSLSAKKMSYDFEELNAYSENLGNYDVIIVDSDTPAPLKILKEKCDRLIFLAPRNQNIDIDAQILQKPFLPTDFLNLLNNKDTNKHTSIDLPILSNDENPYADISLDLDNLNLDDLPDENSLDINSEGIKDLSFDDDAQNDNANKILETQNLEDENLEQETTKEQTQEDIQTDLDLTLEDSKNEKEDLSQEHTALDTEPSLDELDDKNDEDLEIKEDDKNEEIEKQELLDDSKTNALEMQEELSESQDDNANKALEVQNLEDENLEQETTKEQTQENIQTDLDLTLEDSKNEKEDLSQEHTALDTEPSLDELDDKNDEDLEIKEDDKNDEDLEDNKELQANISDFDDLPVVEEQEKEMDFDDLPEDAEFLGQAKDNEESEEILEEFAPVVEEDVQDEMDDFISNLSTQDQIKEELAQLDELDYGIDSDNSSKVLEDFKDEPILDDKELGTNEEEVVVPNLNISDFDALKESDIQEALGEEIVEKNEEPIVSNATKDDNSEEIVNELSQSIVGAITSSIKDDTLKAALKGINMNININISFKED
ncbi:highly acidic protein [Campylobacter jejuni]|uniref:Highly acidic protein n=1 Tax=Campylobacter jejuni TaxID=197 RepID=A0A5T0PW58_CAMJU|nr:highly acidic protein [Campylobacter sp. US53]EAI7225527.1 highly acidic protein [Campylobacter jejuni]EAJ0231680.1 highly acidic protein [Campylobacter jejuni]EAK1947087.1 highly acidic protein [Campylobacter jejuni]EAL4057763.1 highly acidic protein [Campylobacter jejuni]EAL7067105.1 highly acidic protein [Campylobacter jejuni]